ncbi:GGDEF domain-containing protein [Nitrincola alkalilacustris]|uniref:GGDEF domain-containing protein n=1 Tax=Nitrincola alkalilacustris TaxID=1571224 RepID=UPI00124F2FB0|nr:diguanylate cyclase [Nitrincola alkalilacustris]
MKRKTLSRLFADMPLPFLLRTPGKSNCANEAYVQLSAGHKHQIQEWIEDKNSQSLQLDTLQLQRLRAKKHTAIIGYPEQDPNLQRTLMLQLLPALQAGGDPFNSAARILGTLLGWQGCVVAKRKSAKSIDLLGLWQGGSLQAPRHQVMASSAAFALYESDYLSSRMQSNTDQFPLDDLLAGQPDTTWLGHRIDLPSQKAIGHIAAWGPPLHGSIDIAKQLIGCAADLLAAFLASAPKNNGAQEFCSEPLDMLTGLPGRQRFDLALQQAAEHYREDKQDCLIALISLKNLPLGNQQSTRAQSEALLKTFAQELLNICRRKDQVFFFGGTEFVMLMPITDKAPPVAKRLEKVMHALQKLSPQLNAVSALAQLHETHGSSKALMLLADQRMNESNQTFS